MKVEPTKGHPGFMLHFARQYLYLGTQLDEKGNIGLELAHRRREAAPSWRALARQFIRHSSSSWLHEHLHLLDSLILSSRLFNAAVWPMLSGPQLVTLQGDFMRMYRVLLRIPRCDGTAERDAFVLAKVCRPPLPHLFSAMRLRLFGRLLRTGPSYLTSLLSFLSELQPTSWLARVQQDLVWLRTYSHDLASYPSPHSHLER